MSDVKLGTKLDPATDHVRDAVHVAILPVTADHELKPGQPVGLVSYYSNVATADHHHMYSDEIGVVDPFLKGNVQRGEKFYLCMYPNTVKSLRHNWSHDSFGDDDAGFEYSDDGCRGC